MKKFQTRHKYNAVSQAQQQAIIAELLSKLSLQPTVINNYTFMKGSQKVDHIDSQSNSFYYPCTGDPAMMKPAGEELSTDDDNVLIDELTPIFYCNREEAALFLSKIRGAKPMQIVEVVRALIKDRKVSDISCGMPLWQLLHDYNLYPRSLSNWYKLIKA